MRIIAIALQKGGVGKTTTSVNLAFALARKRSKVLLIDLDPQSSLTEYFFPNLTDDETPFKETVYHLLLEERPIKPVSISDFIDLLPANVDLSAAELSLPGTFNPQRVLASVLKSYASYEYVIIDCPPSLGILTINALTSAHKVIIPVSTELMAGRTIKLFISTIERVRNRELNANLQIWRILPTKYDARLSHHKEVLQGYRDRFDKLLYLEPVVERTKYKDAVTAKTDIMGFDKDLGAYWDRLAERLISEWEGTRP